MQQAGTVLDHLPELLPEVEEIAAAVDRIDQRAGGPEWRDWHPEESSPT